MKKISGGEEVSDLVSFGNIFASHCGGNYLSDFDEVK